MATYVNMNHKNANKFRMVQIENRLKFNKLLEENKNIVPCSLYVNKDNGTISSSVQLTISLLLSMK